MTIKTSNPHLIARSGQANELASSFGRISPYSAVVQLIDNDDFPEPPAAAWWDSKAEEIYVHVDYAGIKPKKINSESIAKAKRGTGDFDIMKLKGLLAHEASHSHISRKMEVAMERAKNAGHPGVFGGVMVMFEEIRVEAYAIRREPGLRSALRASFTHILDSIAKNPPTDAAGAARAWALVHGRTLGGISTPTETAGFDTAARTIIGDDIVDQLVDVLQEVLQLSLPDQTERLIELTAEWVSLVGTNGCEGEGSCEHGKNAANGKPGQHGDWSDKPEEGDGEPGAGAGSGSEDGDEEGAGDGEGSGEPTDADGAPGHGVGDSDEDGDDSNMSDYGKEGAAPTSKPMPKEDSELTEGVLNELRKIMQDEWNTPERGSNLSNSTEWAAKVFGRSEGMDLKRTEPTVEERQAVVSVAGFLSNLSVPAIAKTSKALPMPPGRLRTREGVRRSAERSQGMMVTAKPWKGTVRRHSTTRPLVIGLATDTSGSMKWAEKGVADFAYVYANAGHRIGARTAAVTFGDYVHKIARPGEVMTHVVRKTANGGTEECDQALAALDGVLRLTEPGTSAKILIVVSDGALVKDNETGKVTEWLHRMDKAGTHVIWVTDSMPHGEYWLAKLAKKLPNLEYVGAGRRGGGVEGSSVYTALDKVVRKSIIDNIAS